MVPSQVKTEALNPFTHQALIPANAHVESIRFEKMKLVTVPTALTQTMDASACRHMAFAEPGGSMFCPEVRTASSAPAYEVTFSYVGPPTSEGFTVRSSFTTYFRPEELGLRVQDTRAPRKRADVAGYFQVTTSRDPVRRAAIDKERSRFCAGNYVDGVWMLSDASCRDEVQYTTVTAPSGYVTVHVAVASAAR